jgi:hypothetical protein
VSTNLPNRSVGLDVKTMNPNFDGLRSRSRRWSVATVVAMSLLGLLPMSAVGSASADGTSPGTRRLMIVASSSQWAVAVSCTPDTSGTSCVGNDAAFAIDRDGAVRDLSPFNAGVQHVGWSIAQDMLVASYYVSGSGTTLTWWNLRTGESGAQAVPEGYELQAAAPDGWLLADSSPRTAVLWHSDLDGTLTLFDRPFGKDGVVFQSFAGPEGVLVLGYAQWAYLPWANPHRERPIDALDGEAVFCPTVTADAAYCAVDPGTENRKHYGFIPETLFLNGTTATIKDRRFAKQRGFALPEPRTLITSTSKQLSFMNVHGRVITLPYRHERVLKSDGKVRVGTLQLMQLRRAIGALLVATDDGIYRLNTPTSKPHLLVPTPPETAAVR